MSTKLSCNIKNVILGSQNFSDVVGYYSRIRNCFSQLAAQKSILNKPDNSYYNQDVGERRLSNHVKNVLSNGLNLKSLKLVSSEFPLQGKWFDEGITRPICSPELPWQSTYRFYYERKSPQCPPQGPKSREDCKPEPVPPVSCTPEKNPCPRKKKSKCGPCDPKPKKKGPCGRKSPCSKCIACTMRNISFSQCRLCSCGGGKKQCEPIKKKCGGKSNACGGAQKNICGGGGGKKSKCAAISEKCGGGGKASSPCGGPKKCG